MNKFPEIRHAMSAFPYSTKVDSLLLEAKKLMQEHKIHHLPVTENGKIAGILSDRDVSLALSLASHVVDEGTVLVGDVCTKEPYIVSMDEPLDQVATTMAERHIGSAVVVKNDKPVGIFTVTDACRYLGEFLRSTFDRGPEDPLQMASKG